MHHAQRGVAVLDRADHDAYRAHVEQLLERELLALHLAPDAVDVLGPAVDCGGRDAGLAQLALQQLAHVGDVALAIQAPLGQRTRDAVIGLGLEIAEREILEFPLQAPDAEPIGQRGEDLARLQRQPLSLGLGQCARRAQLHQLVGQVRHHQPRVGGHGQQHLAQHFGLLRIQALAGRPAGRQVQLSETLELGGDARAARRRGALRSAGSRAAVRSAAARCSSVPAARSASCVRAATALRGLEARLERGRIGAELGERRARGFELRGDRGRCGSRGFHAVWPVSSGYHSRYGRLQQVRLRIWHT